MGRRSFLFPGKEVNFKVLNDMCIPFDIHLGMDNVPPNYMENGNHILIQADFLIVNQPLPMALYCNDFTVSLSQLIHVPLNWLL